MPDFTFTDPNGKNFTVNGPEGATKEQAFTILQQHLSQGTQAPGKIPQQDPMGAGGSFVTGLQDPLVGGNQLIAHLAKSPEEAQKVDTQVKAREAQLQQQGVQPVMRGLGEATTGLPLMAAGPAGIAGAAIGGAAGGALQPETGKGDYWSQKTDDVLMGTAFGAGGGAAVKTLGAILGPSLRPEAKALVESGVQLTPGQMAGGLARRAEEAFKSLPILGSFIRGAEGRGIEGFNKAVLNQALEPIGQKLSPGTRAGQMAIKETKQKLGAAYDAVLPQIKLGLDHDLAQDFSNIRHQATELPRPQEEQFEKIIQNRVVPFFQPQPGAVKPTLKTVTGALQEIADSYRGSGDPAQRLLAQRLDDTKKAMNAGMVRQNPQLADQLKKIDAGWAMFARAEGAATRRATSESVFTPNDLLQVIKSQDKSVRRGRFSQGDALLQLYATYGQKVLPGKMPDSGTPERLMYDAAFLSSAAGAGTGHVSPLVPIALGGAAAPYTSAGMGALNAVARNPLLPRTGAAVRGAAPYAGIAGAPVGLRQGKDETPQYGGPQQ